MTQSFKERVETAIKGAIGINWYEYPEIVDRYTDEILKAVRECVGEELKDTEHSIHFERGSNVRRNQILKALGDSE